MTSLWERLDDAYLAAFVAAMSRSGDYTDLQIVTAEIADTWKPETISPQLIIVSDEGSGEHAGHAGASAIRVAETITYYAVAVAVADSQREAKRAAQELRRRMRSVLQGWPDILSSAAAAGSTGETPIRQKWGKFWIQVRGRQSGDKGKHYGIAVHTWTVEITA